jgi:hypothetical protein
MHFLGDKRTPLINLLSKPREREREREREGENRLSWWVKVNLVDNVMGDG